MKRIFIILTILIFTGCSKDPLEDYDINNKESSNSIFKPYLNQFKKEAEKRGYDYTDYEIEFYLADIDGKPAGGVANFSNNEIFIDRDNWSAIHPTRKEELIFHELGHSILKRKHTNKQTENEGCLSYMMENSYECQKNSYSLLWREYYFDELFDESTSLPLWYRKNNKYNFNYENKELLVQELDNDNRSFQFDIDTDTISNFVLEVTFKNWQSASERDPFRNTKVNLNGINYESNPNRNSIHISDNEYSKRYWSKWDYNYEEDIKLTVRRYDGIYSFFIDEKYIHATDIEYFETQSINISFSQGVNKDIVLFKFD
ncbi:hypothetical protein LB465_14020 [Salegentibacter sp. LM13S]|uniref:hypothetical protein n=1 Tax=Salegentibacter lacus TaxID=2873599 RepID=UPI001CCAF665|nr:hypothetical protein [Salegentibacter lacus]MBZ9631901.1 hypothetical protein [Salegentibacter lacus]